MTMVIRENRERFSLSSNVFCSHVTVDFFPVDVQRCSFTFVALSHRLVSPGIRFWTKSFYASSPQSSCLSMSSLMLSGITGTDLMTTLTISTPS